MNTVCIYTDIYKVYMFIYQYTHRCTIECIRTYPRARIHIYLGNLYLYSTLPRAHPFCVVTGIYSVFQT